MVKTYLPNHTVNRLAVKLKAKSEVYVRQGHPWIFESSIVKINDNPQSGDIAIVFDQKKNKFLAIGLYDPYSPIAIKVLHQGTSARVDGHFFIAKVKQAYAERSPLLATDTNGYRLIFGENDGLPGVIIDVYAGVAVIKLYSAAWKPHLHHLVNAVLETISCDAIVLRLARLVQKKGMPYRELKDGLLLYGELSNEEIIFKEHGVLFKANVIKGHKTGYFLDHRHNRYKVGQMAEGKSVLDVFSYAGGFSTHAVVGGATEVVSIDISSQALELAKENVILNNTEANHKTMAVDAFIGMQQLIDDRVTFDIVVVDPPSFAKMSEDIPVAKKSYERLAALAIQLVKRGGYCIMASCSSRISRDEFYETMERGFDTQSKSYRLIEKTYHDIDHPISFPEGSYLKSGYYEIG